MFTNEQIGLTVIGLDADWQAHLDARLRAVEVLRASGVMIDVACHIDDFAAGYRDNRAPIDAIRDKIPYLLDLGVNAIEFMPWTAWRGGTFNWGYDPFLFFSVEDRYLDDPTDPTHAGLFRGFILRNSDVGAAALSLDVFLFRCVCANHLIWGFQHVAGFRRRHVGASIQDAWTTSLNDVRVALDADTANDRTQILRAMSQELGSTRDAVLDTAVQRLDVSQKQATEAYTLAEQFETNPRSVWGYVQGLTRLSQRTPWQDGRFALDRAAGRLLTTVH